MKPDPPALVNLFPFNEAQANLSRMNPQPSKPATATVVICVIIGIAAALALLWLVDFAHLFGRIVTGIIRFILNLFRALGA